MLGDSCPLFGYVMGSVTSNESLTNLQGITNDWTLIRCKTIADIIKKMHCTICTICTMVRESAESARQNFYTTDIRCRGKEERKKRLASGRQAEWDGILSLTKNKVKGRIMFGGKNFVYNLFILYRQQRSISIRVEDIRLDRFVVRELINQLQIKYQTRLFIVAIRMDFCLISDTCNLY